MNIWNKAKERWNNETDSYNKWDTLDINEIEDLVMEELNLEIKELIKVIKQKSSIGSDFDSVIKTNTVIRLLKKVIK